MTTPPTTTTRLLAAALLLGALGPATAARSADDFRYERRATRAETRSATLARYQPAIEAGPWHAVGPFDNEGMDKHDLVYPPEANPVDPDFEGTFVGKGGATLRWIEIPDDDWSYLDLKSALPGDDEMGVAYLFREVHCAAAGRVRFNAGSDDGLKLWVNGGLVLSADVYRGFNLTDHELVVNLDAGRNTILAKVTQGVGGWDFQMKPVVDSRLLALLEYHLDRDFPDSPELRHYRPLSVLEPEEVVLEVGGIALLPDGRPVVTTRRGEAWVVDGAYDDPPFDARYTRFAFGLHEPLGAWWDGRGVLVTQRGETTRLVDDDGDDRADRFETVTDDWGVSGNYHEFAFGPEPDAEGRWWVTLNVGFCGGLGKSIVPWRGWAVMINEDGTIEPVCGGLRSPNGIGRNAAGAMFATDNQGDWVGTNKLMHLAPGDWHGHPSGLRWYAEAGIPTPDPATDFKPPAIWFPYDVMGRSASDIELIPDDDRFGPFGGQLLVGDQFAATIMRVDLEEVNGVWQGACFPFLSGLDSGVNRLRFAPDGSLFVGMTNRGWWSKGPRGWGLQRVVYSGVPPFDVKTMRATPTGFRLTFTRPVDGSLAGDPDAYALRSFTYHRWEKYGSPEIDERRHAITAVRVDEDGMGVELAVERCRRGAVHELRLPGLRDRGGEPLLHPYAAYTLNEIPAAGAGEGGP